MRVLFALAGVIVCLWSMFYVLDAWHITAWQALGVTAMVVLTSLAFGLFLRACAEDIARMLNEKGGE